MSNPEDSVVEFEGLDKPRRLRVGVNAVSDVEEVAGKPFLEAISAEQGLTSMLRTVLWAALRWEDPKLTRERTGQLLEQYLTNGGKLDSIHAAVWQAIKASPLFQTKNGEG